MSERLARNPAHFRGRNAIHAQQTGHTAHCQHRRNLARMLPKSVVNSEVASWLLLMANMEANFVANAVALQTVAGQTQALHELRRRGIEIPAEDLAYFSHYPTSRVKRFGQYPASIKTDIQPPNKHLPPRSPAPVAAASRQSGRSAANQ